MSPSLPGSLRINLSLTGRGARVIFREVPESLSRIPERSPSLPGDGTEVEDASGILWTAVEVDAVRPSAALASGACLLSGAGLLVIATPAACAGQLRKALAYGLVALLGLAREHAASREPAR